MGKGRRKSDKMEKEWSEGIYRDNRGREEAMITSFGMTVESNKINLEAFIGFASRNSMVTIPRSISKKRGGR